MREAITQLKAGLDLLRSINDQLSDIIRLLLQIRDNTDRKAVQPDWKAYPRTYGDTVKFRNDF
jgi:hypothetical protein